MSRPLQSAMPWHNTLAQLRLASTAKLRLHTLALIALTAVGFALRLGLLHTFPLREDEAIYGYWARSAITDPFFIHTWPDKPPLFIWFLTGVFALMGPSEASARLVSIFASTLTIPIVALTAQRLWHSRTAAWMAAFLLVFNPYAVSFAPTAYTDSLLVLFGSGAILMALKGRGLAAGLFLGAACMTKQQGLFYAPLIVALFVIGPIATSSPCRKVTGGSQLKSAMCCHPVGVSLPPFFRRDAYGMTSDLLAALLPTCFVNLHQISRKITQLGLALLGVAFVVLPILWWDSQRWAVAPSPWELAQRTYAPLALVPVGDWWERAVAWWQLLWYLGGHWLVWAMFGVALVVNLKWLVTAFRRSAERPLRGDQLASLPDTPKESLSIYSGQIDAYGMTTRNLVLLLLLGWGFAFLLVHIITTVQVWDRYLLPLAPWLAVVASGPLIQPFFVRWMNWLRGVLMVLLLVGLVEVATLGMQAARGEMPLGGDHGDYAGLTQAIDWVQAQGDSTSPAILYHQMLGWHYRFYLYDEIQVVGDTPPRFDLRWFPSAAYLADNAAKSPYPPKYLIVPDWATPRDLAFHLAVRGLAMDVRTRIGRFAVIEIVQPARPWCDWCKSSQPFLP